MAQELLESTSYLEESGSFSQGNFEGSWEAIVDPETNRLYYWNTMTGVTQWDKPESKDDRLESSQSTYLDPSIDSSLVSELIQSEESRQAQRFESMKTGARELRRIADPHNECIWKELQAANFGPIFYARVDGYGGQWSKPSCFVAVESMPVAKSPVARAKQLFAAGGNNNSGSTAKDILSNVKWKKVTTLAEQEQKTLDDNNEDTDTADFKDQSIPPSVEVSVSKEDSPTKKKPNLVINTGAIPSSSSKDSVTTPIKSNVAASNTKSGDISGRVPIVDSESKLRDRYAALRGKDAALDADVDKDFEVATAKDIASHNHVLLAKLTGPASPSKKAEISSQKLPVLVSKSEAKVESPTRAGSKLVIDTLSIDNKKSAQAPTIGTSDISKKVTDDLADSKDTWITANGSSGSLTAFPGSLAKPGLSGKVAEQHTPGVFDDQRPDVLSTMKKLSMYEPEMDSDNDEPRAATDSQRLFDSDGTISFDITSGSPQRRFLSQTNAASDIDVTNQIPQRLSNSDRNTVGFKGLIKQSLVLKQAWPWTCYVHMITGKRFFFNDEDDYGQYEVPLSMQDTSVPFEDLLHVVEVEQDYSPLVEPSKTPSSQVFSDYKKELIKRRKQAAAQQLKDAASKTLISSSMYERNVEVNSPLKYKRDTDDAISSSFLTSLLDEGIDFGGRTPKQDRSQVEYTSPYRNGLWQSSSTPVVRSALAGPSTRVQAISERRAIRLTLMSKIESFAKAGEVQGPAEDETAEAKQYRRETAEEYRRKVSVFTPSQSKDFKVKYAPPKGLTAAELEWGIARARELAQKHTNQCFLAINGANTSDFPKPRQASSKVHSAGNMSSRSSPGRLSSRPSSPMMSARSGPTSARASASPAPSPTNSRRFSGAWAVTNSRELGDMLELPSGQQPSSKRIEPVFDSSVSAKTKSDAANVASVPPSRQTLDDRACWELLRRIRKLADKSIWPTAGTISKAVTKEENPKLFSSLVPRPASPTSPNHSAKAATSATPSTPVVPFGDKSAGAAGVGKKRRQEKSIQTLKQKASQAAKAAVLAMRFTQEANRLHDQLHEVMHVLDTDAELGSRVLGRSWIESELAQRHLLEAAVIQRTKLVFPFGLRDAKAMPTLNFSQCCPQVLNVEDLKRQLNLEDGIIDDAVPRAISWEETYNRGWKVFSRVTTHRSDALSDTVDPSSSTPTPAVAEEKKFSRLYVNEHSNIVQIGEPFDLLCRRQRKDLREELREDYDPFLDCIHDGSVWQENHHDILTDIHGGFVFYQRKRDLYTPTLSPDPYSGGHSIAHIYDKGQVSDQFIKTFQNQEFRDKVSRGGDKMFMTTSTEGLDFRRSLFSTTKLDQSLPERNGINGPTKDVRKQLTSSGGLVNSLKRRLNTVYQHTIADSKEARDDRPDRIHPKTNSNVWFSMYHPVLLDSTVSHDKTPILDAAQLKQRIQAPVNGRVVPGPPPLPPQLQEHVSFGEVNAPSTRIAHGFVSPSFADVFVVSRPLSFGDTSTGTSFQVNKEFSLPMAFASALQDGASTKAAVTFLDTIESVSETGDESKVGASGESPEQREPLGAMSTRSAGIKPIPGGTDDQTFQEIETLLESATASGKDEMIATEFERSTTALNFERCFTVPVYEEYRQHIAAIAKEPDSVGPLLSFALWFANRNLGKQALMCLKRVYEIVSVRPTAKPDLALLRLLIVRLTLRYFRLFSSPESVLNVATLCPESSIIQCQAAQCLRQLMLERDAERLFVGSLLLDPLNPTALRAMAHFLAQRGQFVTASRYLNRISTAEVAYPLVRVELGALLELQGADVEAIVVAYKVVLGLQLRDRATSLALHSLGHIFHVRGDSTRALDYYARALRVDATNSTAAIMAACIGPRTAEYIPSFAQQPTENVNRTAAEVDSLFRKGLVYQAKSSWISLVAYADFVISHLGDYHKAESLLWAAVNVSLTAVVWPVLSLAHYYQYVMGDVKMALQVLRWCTRRRKVYFNKDCYPDDDWETGFVVHKSEDSDDEEEVIAVPESGLENVVHDGQNSALCTALAYVYIDLDQDERASSCIRCALAIDPGYGPASRCSALLAQRELAKEPCRASGPSALKLLGVAVSSCPSNPYTLKTYAIALARDCRYEEAIKYMKQAAELGGNCPLTWHALGMLTYLYAPTPEIKFESIGYFSKSLELSPSPNPELFRLKGQVLMEHGKLAEARACFQQALAIQPRDPITIASMALVVAALGGPIGVNLGTGHGDKSGFVEAILKPNTNLPKDEDEGNDEKEHNKKPKKTSLKKKKRKSEAGGGSSISNAGSAISGNSSSIGPAAHNHSITSHAMNAFPTPKKQIKHLAVDSNLATCLDPEILFKASFAVSIAAIELKRAQVLGKAQANLRRVENAVDPRLRRKLASQQLEFFPNDPSHGTSKITPILNTTSISALNAAPEPVLRSGVDDDFDDVESDVSPVVLYWYGMHQLKKGTEKAVQKAHGAFLRAVQRSDTTPHALSVYMLGWLEESKGDLVAAESMYTYALQLEPFEPLQFLRLHHLIADTYALVKSMLSKCQTHLKKASKKASMVRTSQSNLLAIFDELAPLGLTMSSFNQLSNNRSDFLASGNLNGAGFNASSFLGASVTSGISAIGKPDAVIHETKHSADDDGDEFAGTIEQREEAEAAKQVEAMKARLILHTKIVALSKIKREQMKKHITGLQLPAKYVHIDSFWQERLLHAFTKCDDWAHLLRASKQFANKGKSSQLPK